MVRVRIRVVEYSLDVSGFVGPIWQETAAPKLDFSQRRVRKQTHGTSCTDPYRRSPWTAEDSMEPRGRPTPCLDVVPRLISGVVATSAMHQMRGFTGARVTSSSTSGSAGRRGGWSRDVGEVSGSRDVMGGVRGSRCVTAATVGGGRTTQEKALRASSMNWRRERRSDMAEAVFWWGIRWEGKVLNGWVAAAALLAEWWRWGWGWG